MFGKAAAKSSFVQLSMGAVLALSSTAVSTNDLDLTVLEDVNPAENIVEVYLEAAETDVSFAEQDKKKGKDEKKVKPVTTRVWAYNGSIPGPLIEANVGDVLIVHFTNNLPESTTVHWHGLETPAHMDGSNIAQLEVPGNGGYFRYEFPLLTAGTFWYHPHIRTNEQVEKGLAGALVVRDPAEDKRIGFPRPETIMVLDDILLDENRQVAEPFPSDPLERSAFQLNGREGNVLLVNGHELPAVHATDGVSQRWRIVNISNARSWRLSVPGHDLVRVGGDGGLLEHPITLPPIDMIPDPENPGQLMSNPDPDLGLLLTPGERADVIITPRSNTGEDVFIEWHDFPRGRHSTFYKPDGSIGLGDADDDGKRPPIAVMRMKFVAQKGRPKGTEFVPPTTLRTIDRIDAAGAAPLPVVFGHTPPNASGDVLFFVAMKNGMPLPFNAVSASDAADVLVGETRVWNVVNRTGADHPFHAHGWFFQPIETIYKAADGTVIGIEPWSYLENKDTVRVPARPGAPGTTTTVRMAVHFNDDGREGEVAAYGKQPFQGFSGGWVFHCHILEHADLGMMSFFNVRYPDE